MNFRPLKVTVSKGWYGMQSDIVLTCCLLFDLEVLKETMMTSTQSMAKWIQLLPLIFHFWLKEKHLKHGKKKTGTFWKELQHHKVQRAFVVGVHKVDDK